MMLYALEQFILCTDIRICVRDSLAAILEAQTGNIHYVLDTMYLFCDRRADHSKEKGRFFETNSAKNDPVQP